MRILRTRTLVTAAGTPGAYATGLAFVIEHRIGLWKSLNLRQEVAQFLG
jgi:hypothetical protein